MCSDVTMGAGLCSILRRGGEAVVGMGYDFLVIPIFWLLFYAYMPTYLFNSRISRLRGRNPGSTSGD
jgi:hypothetical protein